MAITVICDNPENLLNDIKQEIRDNRIDTWLVDSDGDFTHAPEQWKYHAWLRPQVLEGKLIFNILSSKKYTMTRALYAVYHGRFIEMLLAHFDLKFDNARASAMPIKGDIIQE